MTGGGGEDWWAGSLAVTTFFSDLRVAVEHAEVGDYDGDGEGDDEDAGQRAEGPHDQTGVRLGHHVPVAHGGHGHHGPPQPLRYRSAEEGVQGSEPR